MITVLAAFSKPGNEIARPPGHSRQSLYDIPERTPNHNANKSRLPRKTRQQQIRDMAQHANGHDLWEAEQKVVVSKIPTLEVA